MSDPRQRHHAARGHLDRSPSSLPRGSERRRQPVLLAIRLALAGAVLAGAAGPSIVHAQTPPAQARHYDIPAGDLTAVLNRFAEEAGVLLSAPAGLTRGKASEGLSGSYTVEQGFVALVRAQGLHAVRRPDGSYVLRATPPPAGPPGSDASGGDSSGTGAAEKTLPVVRVTAGVVPPVGELPRPYAGGQVARGGRLGLLGEVDYMETPFSVSSYTAELVRDRQITELRDLIVLDPSVVLGAPRTYYQGGFSLRGFSTTARFAGLKILGAVDLQTDGFERVEIVKGPTVLLNGGADGLGGTVNAVPKRADNTDLTRLTARAESRSQLGGHLDVGRRFGADDRFGIRMNLSGVNGEAAIQDERKRHWHFSTGLDLRLDRVRASVDLIAQRNQSRGFQNYVSYDATSATGAVAPPRDVSAGINSKRVAPINRLHFAEDRGAVGQLEVDVAAATTLRLAHGRLRDVYNSVFPEYDALASTATTDAYTAYRGFSRTVNDGSQASLTSKVDIGSIQHRLSLAYDRARSRYDSSAGDFTEYYTLPAGQFGGAPAIPLVPYDSGLLAFGSISREHSVGIADAFGPRDGRWLVVAGLRRQSVDTSGIWGPPSKAEANSASLGGLVKLDPRLALYANYAEGLEPGTVVPLFYDEPTGVGYENAGEVLPAYRTRQYEAGVKWDGGAVGATVALFQLARPSVVNTRISATRWRQSVGGEQVNRGLEVNVFGEPVSGLRLIAGVTFIEPKLTKTEGGLNDGKVGPSTSRRNLSLTADWAIPGVAGLTASTGVVHKSRQFLDEANTTWIKGYTIVDAGLSYRLPTARPIRLDFQVLNLFDRNYWANGRTGYLGYGDPRTFKLAASVDF